MYRWLIIIVLIILLWAQTTNPSFANDLNFTIDNQTDGGTFNSLQDGEDNDIDFDFSLSIFALFFSFCFHNSSLYLSSKHFIF